jgi:hypothetical protein
MVRRVWILALLLAADVGAQESSWSVQVLHADGKPAAGSLSVTGYGERHELPLDRDGIADLAAPDIYSMQRYFVFARQGKLCTRFVRAPARGQRLRLTLAEGGIFVATVRDGGGKPVTDAEVSLFAAEIPWTWPPLFSGRTGEDGTVRIVGLPLDAPLHAAVTGLRGGRLLDIAKRDGNPRRWTKPGAEQTCAIRFDPPEGRVVRYRAECADPDVDLPCQLEYRAVEEEEKLYGCVQVQELPCDVPLFIPRGCPPLLFRLGLIGERRAADMTPDAGGATKRLVLTGETEVVVRVRDSAGEPIPFGAWHVRVWFLEDGKSTRYPREAHAAAGEGLHVVKLPWPRAMLAMPRFAFRFELRAGAPRSECYPWMPRADEALTVAGSDLVRELESDAKWHVDLTVPVLRKPVFRVQGIDGTPVAGVEIVVGGEEGALLTVRSDAEGVARCDALPADKAALGAVAKPPFLGEYLTGGAGFRGPGPIPFVAFRTRPFRVVARTPSGPVEAGTGVTLSGELPGPRIWSAAAEADASGTTRFDVPLALRELQVEVSDYSQSATRALRADEENLTVDLLERVELRITTTGRREDQRLHVDVVDPATGGHIPVGTGTSSDRPNDVRVTLPARPLRVAVCEAFVDDGRIGIVEWDGKATQARVALVDPALHPLHVEFVDPEGRPLPGLKVDGEWSGEGRFGSLEGVTDERGVRTVSVVPGWVRVSPRIERAGLMGPGPDGVRLQVANESTVRVQLRWWQMVHLRLPPGTSEADFGGKISWRLGEGKWTALHHAPWRNDDDPVGQAKLGFAPGTGAGRIELRIAGQVFAFDYPGRPLEPPLFVVRR